MLFAYQPEGLIATAIFAMIVAIAIPIYSRLGFSSIASVGLGVMTGILIMVGLILRASIADWNWKRRHSKRDSDQAASPPAERHQSQEDQKGN